MQFHWLFSYGTLKESDIQEEIFRKFLVGQEDCLKNYALVQITIEKNIYLAAKFTGLKKDRVQGILYKITTEDLLKADEYETNAYKRVKAVLLSGNKAWVYVANT